MPKSEGKIFPLFYLTVNLWTITPALINSLGPSIAVSVLHKNPRQQRAQESMKIENEEFSRFKMHDTIGQILNTKTMSSPRI